MQPQISRNESAADDLQDLAALWSVGEVGAYEIVEAACAALVVGLDSPTLRILAGCTRTEADYEMPDLLPAVLDELDRVFYPQDVDVEARQDAAVRALARQLLTGKLTPRELALRIHQRFSHQLPLAVRLAELDDAYDSAAYETGDEARTLAEIDANVIAEAQRLSGPRRD
ncbi:hypothetical protein ACFYO9_07550 [Streptomyces sp. NPDC005863]|uniref:hypothetical protein n=1 Tax=unclassified Streptomyces TaxID=2593676 RepID=UPI0033CA9ABF